MASKNASIFLLLLHTQESGWIPVTTRRGRERRNKGILSFVEKSNRSPIFMFYDRIYSR
jgi:hypothetical protein